MGPDRGRLRGRHLGGGDDRRPVRLGRPPVVHGRSLPRRGLRRRGRRQGRPAADADRAAGARFELVRTWPPIGPGSWRLALRTLANPRRYTPATVATGWIPRGVFSTEALGDTIRRVVPGGWSPHPNLWVIACDYETGRRVAFGRPERPTAELADAVAASCAIPGFYHPVTIGGRRYVDGGIYSASNMDLLRSERARPRDLPQPDLHPPPLRGALNPREWVNIGIRRASGDRLGSEAKQPSRGRAPRSS